MSRNVAEQQDQQLTESVINPHFTEASQEYLASRATLAEEKRKFARDYPEEPRNISNEFLQTLDYSQRREFAQAKESAEELSRVSDTIPDRYKKELNDVVAQGVSVDTYIEALYQYSDRKQELDKARQESSDAKKENDDNKQELPQVIARKEEYQAKYDKFLNATREVDNPTAGQRFIQVFNKNTKVDKVTRPAIPREFYDLSPSEIDAVLENKGPEAFKRREQGSIYLTRGTSTVGVSYEDARKALANANVEDIRQFRDVVAQRNIAANREITLNFKVASYEKSYEEFREYDAVKRVHEAGYTSSSPEYQTELDKARSEVDKLHNNGRSFRSGKQEYQDKVSEAGKDLAKVTLLTQNGKTLRLSETSRELAMEIPESRKRAREEDQNEFVRFGKLGESHKSIDERLKIYRQKRVLYQESNQKYQLIRAEALKSRSFDAKQNVLEAQRQNLERMPIFTQEMAEHHDLGQRYKKAMLDGNSQEQDQVRREVHAVVKKKREVGVIKGSMQRILAPSQPLQRNIEVKPQQEEAVAQYKQNYSRGNTDWDLRKLESEVLNDFKRSVDINRPRNIDIKRQIYNNYLKSLPEGTQLTQEQIAFRDKEGPKIDAQVAAIEKYKKEYAEKDEVGGATKTEWNFAKLESEVLSGGEVKNMDAKRQIYNSYLKSLPEGTQLTQKQRNFKEKEGPKVDAQVEIIEKYKKEHAAKAEDGTTKTEWNFAKLEGEVLSDAKRTFDIGRPKKIEDKRQLYMEYLQKIPVEQHNEEQQQFIKSYDKEQRQKEFARIAAEARARAEPLQRQGSSSSVGTQPARRGSVDSMGSRPPTEEHQLERSSSTPTSPQAHVAAESFASGFFRQNTVTEHKTSSTVSPVAGAVRTVNPAAKKNNGQKL
jgi:hypothetical protein